MHKLPNMLNSFRVRKLMLVAADTIIIFLCSIVSNALMKTFSISSISNYRGSSFGHPFLIYVLFNLLICSLLIQCLGGYSKFWRFPGKSHFFLCGLAVAAGRSISYFVTVSNAQRGLLAFFLTDTVLAVAAVLGFHFFFYYYIEHNHPRTRLMSEGKNTLIVGAGRAAAMILDEVKSACERNELNNPARYLNVIGLVDDDPDKFNLKIDNVSVLGNTSDIPAICKTYNVENIYFAIPSCNEHQRQRILQICTTTQAKIFVIPYLAELVIKAGDRGAVDVISQTKEIKIEDLLERPPIVLDKEHIRRFIKNKVCLVTGGGGSIGSELCRQIALYNPKQLIIVDIYENSAYDIQQELKLKYGNELDIITLIASIRDYDKIDLIFKTYRPEIVFHAAAHKHVPLMETVPEEAIKNNVFGTFNVVDIAEKYKVHKFVMISTDKAVNPTNVMGATKRCCEMIIETKTQKKTDTEFVITRFGNVLGSNGSVIPLFMRQLENGMPLTVTHPDITRFFMTIHEAVSLVLEAASMAHGGEVFVLDMGKPVKILTLAENMIRLYGKKPYEEVPIEFTGLRPGEKLYEELFIDHNNLRKTANKKIFVDHVRKMQPDECNKYVKEFNEKLQKLKEAANRNDRDAIVPMLQSIVPNFEHKTNI